MIEYRESKPLLHRWIQSKISSDRQTSLRQECPCAVQASSVFLLDENHEYFQSIFQSLSAKKDEREMENEMEKHSGQSFKPHTPHEKSWFDFDQARSTNHINYVSLILSTSLGRVSASLAAFRLGSRSHRSACERVSGLFCSFSG